MRGTSSSRTRWRIISLLVLFVLAGCGSTANPAAPAGGATAAPTTAARPSPTTARAATAARTAGTTAATATRAGAATPAGTAVRGSASPSVTARAAAPVAQGSCTPQNATKPRPSGRARLVISTGGTGGVFFPYGGGLARILTARLPNTEVTAEVTGGSVDNMKLVQAGDADLGMSTNDSALEAIQGQGVYQSSGAVPACTIAVLYTSFIHVVALDGAGINTIADLRGKRVSVGSAGSSTEVAADRLLEAAGLNSRRDIQRDSLSVAESAGAMKDRRIDAFFWIGGLPTAAVQDLVTTGNVRIKFLPTQQYLGTLTERYGPVYSNFTIPRGTYNTINDDVQGIGVGNILFVNANMSQELVYDILRTLFENQGEVQGVHPEARGFNLQSAATGSSIAFHPGAIRFYQERGVWRP